MPVVVATITPLPEHREAVIAAFVGVIPAVHAEPGCILYALNEAPDRLIMVEQWASQEALEAHSAGDALKQVGVVLAGKLAAPPEVVLLDPVPAGDAEKGLVRPL